jgi:hypothetical protein
LVVAGPRSVHPLDKKKSAIGAKHPQRGRPWRAQNDHADISKIDDWLRWGGGRVIGLAGSLLTLRQTGLSGTTALALVVGALEAGLLRLRTLLTAGGLGGPIGNRNQ